MIHLYSKDGRLSMWSHEPIDAPAFQHDEVDDTALQDLKHNCVDRFENGKLIAKDTPISQSLSAEDIKIILQKADAKTLKSVIDEIVLKLG